tara:strand:- start:55 stop:1962 length:1908 start_codon:yes stop_codon:yes gene_type:complete
MIPELGHIILVTHLILSFLGGTLPLFALYSGYNSIEIPIKKLSFLLLLFITSSFLTLVYSFSIDDFSVAYVAENSNINLPFYYKLAATWGAHEGSLLLWILAMNAWLFSFLFFTNSKDKNFLITIFAVSCQVIFAFSLFTLFTSNPFERILPIPPLNGADLNPSLQDFAFTVHPPLLYFGYSGLMIPFAVAVSAMLFNKDNKEWAACSRPWTLLSCSFLTMGIALGSWWAYYELGWGGWWFWDPVENAAFVPWLLSVALFHSLITTENRGLFGKWSILLSIFAFATSLLGTFLVRSGILTSVHAFALDPERGLFILGILAFFIIGSLGIYSVKGLNQKEHATYSLTSKEFGFLLNNLLLVVLAVSILFGTIFPLIYEAITDGKQISVGAPYFEIILFPFALGLGLLQGIALYLSWGRSTSFEFLPRILLESFSVFIFVVLILIILFDNYYLTSFATLFLASWIAVGTLQVSRKRNMGYWSFLRKRLSVTFAHLGMAILVLGVGVVSSYSLEKEVILAPGNSLDFGDQTIRFQSVNDSLGPNYFSKSAVIYFDDGENLSQLITEKRTYSPSGQLTTEAGIKSDLFKDLYVSMGDNLDTDIWSFKIQIKPFIRWIWLGAIMIAIGSFLAGLKQFRRI